MPGLLLPPEPETDKEERQSSRQPSVLGRSLSRKAALALLPEVKPPPEFGKCSVFDAEALSADALPFMLPVAEYLEEALVGMSGNPASPKGEASSGPARSMWRQMKKALSMDPTRGVCEPLAWIAIGMLFGTVSEVALDELRSQLSQSWFLLTIQLGPTELHGTAITCQHDHLLAALPTILVQVIYRLIIDAFPHDQKQLVLHAQALIEKLTCIVHQEISGYQLNQDTALDMRQRLFRKSVIEKPSVSAVETMNAVRRLTLLENAQAQLQPLAFGAGDGVPLEAAQLEHVLEQREQEMRGNSERRLARKGKGSSTVASGVEHYQQLSVRAEELFVQQLADLYPESRCQSSQSTSVQPEGHASPALTPKSAVWHEASEEPETCSLSVPDTGFYKPGTGMTMRRGLRVADSEKATATQTQRLLRERREAEAVARRRRDELLASRIAAPLPECYSQQPLMDKKGVSPIVGRQLGQDRPQPQLVPGSKRPVRERRGGVGGSTSTSPPKLPLLVSPGSPPNISDVSVRALASAAGDGRTTTPTSRSTTRQRRRTTKDSGFGRGCLHSPPPSPHRRREAFVTISMDPPKRLENQVVFRRLDQQRQGIKQRSFEVYKKDYDLTTGLRKQRLNDESIRQEEFAYVESLEALVGSRSEPALRMHRHRPDLQRRDSNVGLLMGSTTTDGFNPMPA